MRDVIPPEVDDPERFFPEPSFVRSPTVRRLDDGYGEMYHPDEDDWERIHPVCLAILERLERGMRFADLVRDLPPFPDIPASYVERVARKYVWRLATLGYVRIDLEPPPDVFAGRYRRVRELGRGGFGVAHLCTDVETGQSVVVKHAWGVKRPIESGQRTIAIEADVLRKLDHPSCPRLIDLFEVRGLLHIVRDFVDGRPIASAIRGSDGGPRDRREVVRQVAESLRHVHARGFLFFDVTPGNYLRTEDGRVVAIDFGLARPLDSSGVVPVARPRGTPGYVPRELLEGAKAATVRSEIFSLGRLWYTLAAGRRARRLWTEAEFVADLGRRPIAEDEKEAIALCCRDDPAARPASMDEVLALAPLR